MTVKTPPIVSLEGIPWGNSEKLFKPLVLGMTKFFNMHPAVRTTEHCTNRQRNNIY